jgi:hypothetical protein
VNSSFSRVAIGYFLVDLSSLLRATGAEFPIRKVMRRRAYEALCTAWLTKHTNSAQAPRLLVFLPAYGLWLRRETPRSPRPTRSSISGRHQVGPSHALHPSQDSLLCHVQGIRCSPGNLAAMVSTPSAAGTGTHAVHSEVETWAPAEIWRDRRDRDSKSVGTILVNPSRLYAELRRRRRP